MFSFGCCCLLVLSDHRSFVYPFSAFQSDEEAMSEVMMRQDSAQGDLPMILSKWTGYSAWQGKKGFKKHPVRNQQTT